MSLSEPTPLSHSQITVTNPVHGQKVYWRVLISKHGNLYLHYIDVTRADGAAVLLKLKKKVSASRSLWNELIPFLVPVVYVATISPVSTEEIEPQNLPRIVDIDAKYRSHVLTNALRHPTVTQYQLPRTMDFLVSYIRFAVEDEVFGIYGAREALLVECEVSWVGQVTVLLWTVLFALTLGIGVGVWRNDVGLGIGATGGVTGLVGIVEGFLFWVFK